MTKHPNSSEKQAGAALAIGLILLLVATLVAVSAMQGTRFQERMASNHYNKAISYNAAEVGATRFLQALNANDFDIETWATDLGFPSSDAAPAPALDGGAGWGWYWAEVDETIDLDDGDFPVTIFGVSRRQDQANDPSADLALTQLDVRIGVTVTPPGGGGPNDAGINLVGKVNSFEVPNSNALEVCNLADTTKCTNQAKDEEKVPVGPAMGTREKNDAGAIEKALDEKGRLGNYLGDPPVTEIAYDSLWTNPTEMEEFVLAGCAAAGSRCSKDGSVPKDTVVNKPKSHTPNLTVIQGGGTTELEFKGNDAGKGILIVEGNLRTKGTPQWEGLIIVLGGQFHITGGGNGGVEGSLYVLNLDTTQAGWDLNEGVDGEIGVTFKSDGGGNAKFNHNCDVILSAVELLGFKDKEDDPDQAGDLFGEAHGCDPTGGVGPATEGFTEYAIVRWTEVLR